MYRPPLAPHNQPSYEYKGIHNEVNRDQKMKDLFKGFSNAHEGPAMIDKITTDRR
jgi:hypothetical protein